MSYSGTQGRQGWGALSGRMVLIDHYDILWFCEDKNNDRAYKAQLEDEHYHDQPRNRK